MNVIVIPEAERFGSDLYFQYPDGWTVRDAERTVGDAVESVKEAAPGEYQYDDLRAALLRLGVVELSVAVSDACW